MADFCGFCRLWAVCGAFCGWNRAVFSFFVGRLVQYLRRVASLVVFVDVYNVCNFVSGRNCLKNVFMLL